MKFVKSNRSSRSKVYSFLQISRANLLLTSIGHATLGMFLAAGSLYNLFRIETLLFVLLHYSIALFGCNINSYFDYHVDKLYKTYMAESIDRIGKSMVRSLIVFEGVLSVVLIILFYTRGFFIVSILAFIGFVGACLYSAEPVRMKKHGLISPLPVLILYSFPLLGGWFLFQNHFNAVIIVFIIGYMLMNEGFTLVNTCEDYTEDKQQHIVTWAHLFGLNKTIRIAFWFSTIGVLCIGVLGFLLVEKGITMSIPVICSLIGLIGSLVFILKASLEVREIYQGGDIEQQVKLYGSRLQRWFMMTRYPLMITALLILW